MHPISRVSTPPLSTPVRTNDSLIYDNAAVGHQLGVDRNDMLAPAVSRVLVIYTGGTIGMKHTPEHGYIPLPNYFAESLSKVRRFHDPSNRSDHSTLSRASSHESLDSLNISDKANSKEFGTVTNTVKAVEQDGPQKGQSRTFQLPSLITPVSLFGKRIRYSILEYAPLLDSCDITMSDWVRIAGDIKANYQLYDAFIVLHGTDTMAYTASALSFMLEELGKTVIITGSQVPLTEVRNDAVENLLGALTIAGHFVIPEVALYFGKKLYRGNRTSKISAVDFEAFDSPNIPSLVDVGINIDVKWPLVLRPTQIAKFNVCQKLNPNVGSLRLFPGINDTTIRAFLAPPLQGVVLETFGAGNAPARPTLLAALKEASDRGVVIVNCTQCRKGLVTDAYATGKQLSAIGVVPGADMTPECALTKLAYLLGKTPNSPEHVRKMMTRNLRGELTVRAPYQRFSASSNRTSMLVNILMKFSARGKFAAKQEMEQNGNTNKDEEEADLTMSVEEEMLAQKALGPVLLCSAAGSNDLEGLSLLVESMGELINLNCVDYDGRVPLHVACREGHLRIVEYLLLHGAAIHVRDQSGHTPLFDAVVQKRAEVVKILRQAGAHLAESEKNDMGPYWFKAIKNNNIRWVQVALEAGFNVNWADPVEGRRGIDIAVCVGRVSMLRTLLNQPRIDLAASDKWGMTILDKLELFKSKLEANHEDKQASPETIEEMRSMLTARINSTHHASDDGKRSPAKGNSVE
ncbi:asparaginase-domain-containing protein [Parasitella parasitica]|nr:asparaginase-domain-containing protein [Parasitella parasitica]